MDDHPGENGGNAFSPDRMRLIGRPGVCFGSFNRFQVHQTGENGFKKGTTKTNRNEYLAGVANLYTGFGWFGEGE